MDQHYQSLETTKKKDVLAPKIFNSLKTFAGNNSFERIFDLPVDDSGLIHPLIVGIHS